MRNWNQLQSSAKRLDIEIHNTAPGVASLVDVASLRPLVTVTIGDDVHRDDRDYVLRAAISAAMTAIRARGA